MNLNFKYALAIEEKREVSILFDCEDFEVLEMAMEAISQGRNIRYGKFA